MEYKKKINIRISDGQLARLMSTMVKEKVTLSTLVRNILHGYNEANSNSTDKVLKTKGEK